MSDTQPSRAIPRVPRHVIEANDAANRAAFRPFMPRVHDVTAHSFGPVSVTQFRGEADSTTISVGKYLLSFSRFASQVTFYAGERGIRIERDDAKKHPKSFIVGPARIRLVERLNFIAGKPVEVVDLPPTARPN